MASRLQNLTQLFSDVKTRTMIIFTGAVLLVGVVIAIIGIRKSANSSQLPTQAQTVGAPAKIRSLPGLESPSEQYTKLQKEMNLEQAKAARAQGTSVIPTLIGEVKKDDKRISAVEVEKASTNPQLAILQKQLQQQQLLLQRQRGQLQQRHDQRLFVARQQQQAQLQQAMENQARQLFSSWSNVPKHIYVRGRELPKKDTGTTQGTQGVAGSDNQAVRSFSPGFSPAYIKAGDVLFAVLTTAVNSDEPGPVMATIVSPGKLQGAKLMGTLRRVEKRVMMQFTVMSLPKLRNSIRVKAFAIDPDTARTALATSVNSHYLMRYGTLFASAFLDGYAQAVESSGTTTSTTGDTIVQTNESRSAKDRIIMGLGQVGTALGNEINLFNTPPTVKVASGTSVGLLFLGDVEINGEVLLPQGHPTAVGAASLDVPGFSQTVMAGMESSAEKKL